MSSFYQVGKEIGDEDNYIEIKKLVEMSKTTGKELTFDEFYNIMKDSKEKKKKYYYQNYAYKGYLKNNKTFQNNRYSQNLEETNSSNEFKRYHRKYRGQKSGGDFYNNKSDNIDRNLVYIQFKK